MTVAELISQLKKLDSSTEVWVDTEDGLFPVDMVFEDEGTAILSYTEEIEAEDTTRLN